MKKIFNELMKKLASLLTIDGLVPTYDYYLISSLLYVQFSQVGWANSAILIDYQVQLQAYKNTTTGLFKSKYCHCLWLWRLFF